MNFNAPTIQQPEPGIRSLLYPCQNCGAPVLLQFNYHNCLAITYKKCSRCGLQALHCEDVFDYRFTLTEEDVRNDPKWLRVPEGCLLVLEDVPA